MPVKDGGLVPPLFTWLYRVCLVLGSLGHYGVIGLLYLLLFIWNSFLEPSLTSPFTEFGYSKGSKQATSVIGLVVGTASLITQIVFQIIYSRHVEDLSSTVWKGIGFEKINSARSGIFIIGGDSIVILTALLSTIVYTCKIPEAFRPALAIHRPHPRTAGRTVLSSIIGVVALTVCFIFLPTAASASLALVYVLLTLRWMFKSGPRLLTPDFFPSTESARLLGAWVSVCLLLALVFGVVYEFDPDNGQTISEKALWFGAMVGTTQSYYWPSYVTTACLIVTVVAMEAVAREREYTQAYLDNRPEGHAYLSPPGMSRLDSHTSVQQGASGSAAVQLKNSDLSKPLLKGGAKRRVVKKKQPRSDSNAEVDAKSSPQPSIEVTGSPSLPDGQSMPETKLSPPLQQHQDMKSPEDEDEDESNGFVGPDEHRGSMVKENRSRQPCYRSRACNLCGYNLLLAARGTLGITICGLAAIAFATSFPSFLSAPVFLWVLGLAFSTGRRSVTFGEQRKDITIIAVYLAIVFLVSKACFPPSVQALIMGLSLNHRPLMLLLCMLSLLSLHSFSTTGPCTNKTKVLKFWRTLAMLLCKCFRATP